MGPKKHKITPTELEAAVLGAVWRDGPCTPYMIRQHFLDSPAPRWSGSAGAIYPLVRRLESRGLLRSATGARGRRAQRNYRITRPGLAALKHWLREPIAESEASLIHDPLRTRLLFWKTLPRKQAGVLISRSVQALRQTCQRARHDLRAHPVEEDPFAHFAARNALLVTQARVRWLVEIQRHLAFPDV